MWSLTTAAFPIDLLVMDTFTGSGSLTSHTPDVNVPGTPWSVTGGPTPVLTGGGVGITPGTSHVQATLQTGAADVRMAVDYRVGSGAQRLAGLVFRFTDVNNHVLLLFYENGLHFYRRQDGVYTLLGSSQMGPIASGSTHRLEVRTSGAVMTSYWDGVVQFGVSDTFQQTATRHGLDWNPAVDTAATFDNLEVRNNGTPLAPPGAPGNPSPSNAANGVATNATMSWSATGATSYDVAFGTVNPPPPVTTAQSGTTYTPPPMATSTTYFWQVTARNAGGSTAGPVWTFTTGAPPPPPGVPGTPSPANAATGVATTAALTWSASGATTYDVAFGTANPPPPVATGLTNATYSPVMAVGTTYFWQITARNAGGSTVGPVWFFATAAQPTDLVVSDTFSGTGLLASHVPDVNVLGLSWLVHGGTGNPSLGGGRVGVTPGTGHVQAVLSSGIADMRLGVDYHVGTSPNQMASLVFRFFDTDNHSLLMFYDNALHLYTRQAGVFTLLASSAQLPPVVSGSAHRIEVRASGSQLTGSWDGVQMVAAASTFMPSATMHGVGWNTAFDPLATFDNFEIRDISGVPPPSVPATPGPANAVSGVATNTTLSWSATGAASYDVHFGTANPPTIVSLGQPNATYAPILAPATTYFWRIVAKNNGRVTVGPVWTFTTAGAVAAPSVPVVVGPPDGATGVWINVPLTWSSTGATSYDLAFGTANPPTTTLVSGLTSPTYTPPTAINTTYFWRVTARNAGGTTVGPVWTFDTNVPPSLLVRDRFSGLSGTPLSAHAPEINVPGAAWSITGSTTPPTLINGRVGVTVGTQHVQATLLVGVPDVEMAVDYYPGTAAQPLAGLVFRFTDESNHLSAVVLPERAAHLSAVRRRVHASGRIPSAHAGCAGATLSVGSAGVGDPAIGLVEWHASGAGHGFFADWRNALRVGLESCGRFDGDVRQPRDPQPRRAVARLAIMKI